MLSHDHSITCRIFIFLGRRSAPGRDEPAESSHDQTSWSAYVILDIPSIDLAEFTRRGLFWTTQNLVGPLDGHRCVGRDLLPTQYAELADKEFLSWRLREFPGRPADESRWTGRILVYSELPEALSEFRLAELTRHHIHAASVFSPFNQMVLRFDKSYPERNMHELSDDPLDLWWLWPMESVIADKTPELGQSSSAASIKSEHVEKAHSAGHIREMGVVSVLRLLESGFRVLSGGITLLWYLTSMTLLLLSAGVVTALLRWDGSLESLADLVEIWQR